MMLDIIVNLFSFFSMFRSLIFSLSLAIVFLGSFLSPVFAQSGDTGIRIRPAMIEELIEPGVTETFTVGISNLSTVEQTYYLYTRDIVSATDEGVPVFATEGIERTEFELRQWITLGTDSFILAPNEEFSLPVTISVPQSASPGTHFGGVFISVEPPEMRSSGAAVGYEVANIIAIRVAGEATEKASIRQFSTENYVYGSPEVNFNVKIENTGNTLIRPSGPLTIKNMFGTTVGELLFNEQLGGVFPGNTREFDFSWSGEPPGFGRYEARVSPVFGEVGAYQTLSSTVTFWIMPMNIILPALGILAALLLVTFGIARLYIRRTLAQYSGVGTTRRITRRRKGGGGSAFLLVSIVMVLVTVLFLGALVILFA